MARENYSRYFCKQEVIKFLLTYSFRKMLITGLISKHNHVTYFRRELVIFFWFILVDFFFFEVWFLTTWKKWCIHCRMSQMLMLKSQMRNAELKIPCQQFLIFHNFSKALPNFFFFLTCYFGETHHLVYETRLERELVCLYIYHQLSVLPSFSLSAYTPQSTFPKFFFNGLILTTWKQIVEKSIYYSQEMIT